MEQAQSFSVIFYRVAWARGRLGTRLPGHSVAWALGRLGTRSPGPSALAARRLGIRALGTWLHHRTDY